MNTGLMPPSSLLGPNDCLGPNQTTPPPPGACNAIWSPSLNSTMLGTGGFNADVKNVDANDWITYGVVVENRGSGLNGAFNVVLNDSSTIPVTPVIATGLRAHDGNRNWLERIPAIPTGFPMALKDPGTTPVDPGSLDRFSLTSGNNLAVVTYSYRLPPGALTKIGTCYTNTSALQSYTASLTGQNGVAAGFGERLGKPKRASIRR
ncbi:MAG: hypothetical protein IPN69_08680 [Acidobacteria bacterium]|nr:hypothetical protein [Acidobacteriota bacterium]